MKWKLFCSGVWRKKLRRKSWYCANHAGGYEKYCTGGRKKCEVVTVYINKKKIRRISGLLTYY